MQFRTKYSNEISSQEYGKKVTVAGWVQEIRNLGGIAFIQLRDKGGIVQVTVVKKGKEKMFKDLTTLPRESVISVQGTVKKNEEARAGFELLPKKVKVISKAHTPLPLGVVDKVSVELDTRLDHRFVDLRKAKVRAIFKIRDTLLSAIRKQLREENFVEVHTPKIVASATEGGTALFPIRYFDDKAFLTQSPQLYKQILMGAGFDRVYEIAPAFRAEEHDTRRHLNEYTSVDIEQAFANEEDVMQVLERCIRKIIALVNEGCEKEIIPVPETPFLRVEYRKCVKLARAKDIPQEFGEDFLMEAVKAIGEEFEGFYFITRWPTKAKPFYINPYEDTAFCRAFDLMYRENEIASGGQRVWETGLLKKRLREQGLNPQDFRYYIEAFEYGMPPHAGWGLGVERTLMAITDAKNIRECVLFPRDRKRLVP